MFKTVALQPKSKSIQMQRLSDSDNTTNDDVSSKASSAASSLDERSHLFEFSPVQKSDLGFTWEVIESSLKTHLDVVDIRLKLQTFSGPVVLEFPVQKLVLNPLVDIADMEASGLSWARNMGLYPDLKMKGLEATFVAGLIATCYPDMPHTDSLLLDKWIRTLFAIDDDVDEGPEISLLLLKKNFQKKRDVLTRIAEGQDIEDVLRSETSSVIRALGVVFLDIKNRLDAQGFGLLIPEFIESTDRYFVSVIREKETEISTGRLTDDRSAHIRAESSGAVHAITGAAILLGISTTKLVKPDASFDYLLRCTALCVEFANDFLSQTKEMISLLTGRGQLPLAENIEALKEIKRFNLVHIFWAEGTDMREAYDLTLAQYTKSFIGYQEQRVDLLQSLENEKKEVSSRGVTDSPRPDSVPDVLERERQVKAYLSITDGWMSHVWWALVARRYNLTYTGNPVKDLQAVNTKKS